MIRNAPLSKTRRGKRSFNINQYRLRQQGSCHAELSLKATLYFSKWGWIITMLTYRKTYSPSNEWTPRGISLSTNSLAFTISKGALFTDFLIWHVGDVCLLFGMCFMKTFRAGWAVHMTVRSFMGSMLVSLWRWSSLAMAWHLVMVRVRRFGIVQSLGVKRQGPGGLVPRWWSTNLFICESYRVPVSLLRHA